MTNPREHIVNNEKDGSTERKTESLVYIYHFFHFFYLCQSSFLFLHLFFTSDIDIYISLRFLSEKDGSILSSHFLNELNSKSSHLFALFILFIFFTLCKY